MKKEQKIADPDHFSSTFHRSLVRKIKQYISSPIEIFILVRITANTKLVLVL
jgi:hypothetical protein